MKTKAPVTRWLMEKELRDIEVSRENLQRYKNTILQYEEGLRTHTAARDTEEVTLQKLNKNLPDREKKIEAKSKEFWERLNKHALFESGEMISGNLFLNTKLLFTDIREKEGSRSKNRCCIGSFAIKIGRSATQAREVNIHNRLFNSQNYNHWGVSSRVCWGEWEKDIDRLLSKSDIYGLFDIITHFLKEADMDGAAFRRSHDWRDRRTIQSIPIPSPHIKDGEHVICFAKDIDGMNMLGRVGMVTTISGRSFLGQWKTDTDDSSMLGASFEWSVSCNLVAKITKVQFLAKSRYKIKEYIPPSAEEQIITALDAAESGSTFEDASNIITEISSKKEAILSLEDLVKS